MKPFFYLKDSTTGFLIPLPQLLQCRVGDVANRNPQVDGNALLLVIISIFYLNICEVITQGYVRVTSKFARIYFFSFHLLCVIVVLK